MHSEQPGPAQLVALTGAEVPIVGAVPHVVDPAATGANEHITDLYDSQHRLCRWARSLAMHLEQPGPAQAVAQTGAEVLVVGAVGPHGRGPAAAGADQNCTYGTSA